MAREHLEQGQFNSLGLATREYKRSPIRPEKVTAFWRAFWAENGRMAGISISVPESPFISAELQDMRRKGKGPIYVPEEVSIQNTRYLLGKMFPKMQHDSVEEGNSVTNEAQNFGWRIFDMSIDAPHLGTNESWLREVMVYQGDEEPNLNEYIVASQASKLLTGEYLDEVTRSRILGSRRGGFVVLARFLSDGRLLVPVPWPPDDRDSGLGGRFSRGV